MPSADLTVLDVIDKHSKLEWWGFTPRTIGNPTESRPSDQSDFAPQFVFRFYVQNEAFIEKLIIAVESFVGREKWLIRSFPRKRKGTNWVIAPALCFEIEPRALSMGLTAQQLISKENPDAASRAHDDCDELAGHLERELRST